MPENPGAKPSRVQNNSICENLYRKAGTDGCGQDREGRLRSTIRIKIIRIPPPMTPAIIVHDNIGPVAGGGGEAGVSAAAGGAGGAIRPGWDDVVISSPFA